MALSYENCISIHIYVFINLFGISTLTGERNLYDLTFTLHLGNGKLRFAELDMPVDIFEA